MQLRVSQLAVVAFLALPAPAAFGQLFGSIAYSEKDRQYGWANNYPTRAAAEKAAVESCRTSGKNCRSVLWFRNGCGALVTGPDGHGAGWAATEPGAVNNALKACAAKSGACALTRSFCTKEPG
jgi:hypothetical protein